MNKNHKNNDEFLDEPEEENQQVFLLPPPWQGGNNVDIRMVGIYGTIEEKKCKDVISSLYYQKEIGKELTEEGEIISYAPIKFLLSTEGGSVLDMFAVYDTMRDIQQDCEIHTMGFGKVMSAGVLLLAAGAKGKRKIGRNCRLMIHQITSGIFGHLDDQENSLIESKWVQERYIDELCSLTKLTKKKISSIFKTKLDYYFDAQDAIKLGIVDDVI